MINKIDYKAPLIAAILTLLFMLPCSTALWGNNNIFYDTVVYIKMASWINQGLLPYSQIFDHKGLLFYFYDALALKVAGIHGTWGFDSFLVFLNFWLFYKTARIVHNPRQAFLIILTIWFYMSVPFYWGGNFPEILSLTAVNVGSYIFIKHLSSKLPLNSLECVVLLMAFWVAFFSKANYIAALCVYILYFLVNALREKQTKIAVKYVVFGLTGSVIVLLPIGIYLYENHILKDMYDVYFRFNMNDYSKVITPLQRIKIIARISVNASFGYLLFFVYIYKSWKDFPTSFWISFLFIFSCWMDFLSSGYGYRHYLIPFIPIFGIILTMSWGELRHFKTIKYTAVLGIICYGGYNYYLRCKNSLSTFTRSTSDAQLTNYINSHTSKNETIVSYYGNLQRWLYLQPQSASRFFYQTPIFEYNRDFEIEFMNDIMEKKPKFILCDASENHKFIPLGYEICKETSQNLLIRR